MSGRTGFSSSVAKVRPRVSRLSAASVQSDFALVGNVNSKHRLIVKSRFILPSTSRESHLTPSSAKGTSIDLGKRRQTATGSATVLRITSSFVGLGTLLGKLKYFPGKRTIFQSAGSAPTALPHLLINPRASLADSKSNLCIPDSSQESVLPSFALSTEICPKK